MNLPSDALRTIEKSAELLLRGINDQITALKNAIKALEELHASIKEHLPLEPATHDKADTDNRLDNYSGVSADPAAASFPYKGVTSNRMSNP